MNEHNPITPLPDIKRLAVSDEDTGEIAAIKKDSSINMLQWGIDIGRAIASTKYGRDPEGAKYIAQEIVDKLGMLSVTISDESHFMLGLGFGLSDRHKTPIEREAHGIITGIEE